MDESNATENELNETSGEVKKLQSQSLMLIAILAVF